MGSFREEETEGQTEGSEAGERNCKTNPTGGSMNGATGLEPTATAADEDTGGFTVHPQGETPQGRFAHLRTTQRATKAEREAVSLALRSIWETASTSDATIEFCFPETPAGQKECRSLYDGLINFRKKIAKRKLEDFHLWGQIDSLMLCKDRNDSRVFFRKKFGAVSGRSLVILNAAARLEKATSTKVECPVVRPEML